MAAALIGQIAGLTIAVQARDEALAPNLDKLVEAINLIIQSQQAAARRGQPEPAAVGPIEFRKQEAKQPTYVLNLPTGTVPPAARMLMRPTLKLGKDQLVLGASPAAANRSFNMATLPATSSGSPPTSSSRWPGGCPRDMILLTVSDPRDTLPAFVENLPVLVQQMNLLFPAVGAARGRAPRRSAPTT